MKNRGMDPSGALLCLLLSTTMACQSDPAAAHGEDVAAAALRFYQQHVGPQWGFHCDMQPSCSTFSQEAIERHGLPGGLLLTADRLMRDHSLGGEQYARTADGHRLDPVSDHHLLGPGRPAPEDPLDAAPDARREIPVDAATLLDFAGSLQLEGRHEPAAIEYRRVMHLHPGTPFAAEAAERLLLCLVHLKRWSEAQAVLRRMRPGTTRDTLAALVLAERGDPREAASRIPRESREAEVLSGLWYLQAGEIDAARRTFTALPEPLGPALAERAAAYAELPERSVWLAGSMSALLPGSGHIYGGQVADGIVAFLTNSVLIGGSVWAASRKEYVTASAVGVVAVGFYAGNIYGGASAAHRFNEQHRDRHQAETRGLLQSRRAFFGLVPQRDGGALGFYLPF